MSLIIGVDEGTQSVKTAVYDERGSILCSSSVRLRPMLLGPDGTAEHPDDDLWDSLCAGLKALMRDFSGDPADIAGLGLCTIRFCRCLLKKDGTLSQPAMSWMDARVSRPYVHDNPSTAYVTTSSGYITKRLTGENRDTAANYLGAWPLDRDTWSWNGEGIRDFGTDRSMLFELVMPGDKLGAVTAEAAKATGLPEGLPVFATANDKAVEALGVGCIQSGMALISLGTYIAAMTCADMNAGDCDTFWTNLACVPGRYLYETNGIRRGMWMLSWWTDVLGTGFRQNAAASGLSPEEYLNREAEGVPAGSDGLIVIPHWLAGVDKPCRKGMMLGFDGRHGRAHIYRAILEGIALTMKNHIDAADAGVESFCISGGGSKSDVFMQIFADVLNRPVTRPGENASAGLGAAVCAAVGLGLWPDFDAAVKNMARPGTSFLPDPANAAVYRRLNAVYAGLDGFGDDLFEKLYAQFG